MKSFRFSLIFLFPLWLFWSGCFGTSYQYISAEELAPLVREGKNLTLIDIQVAEDFAEEHLKGAISTTAFPVKSAEDKAKIDAILSQIKPEGLVIVVCPQGKIGAERTYKHLLSKGVAKERLRILTDGQYGWPREKISDILEMQ